MKANTIIEKLVGLEQSVGLPKGAAVELRSLDVKVKEYTLQEKGLSEIIDKEVVDLMDYVTMKKARIEALSEMLATASAKKAEALEQKARIEERTDGGSGE